MADISVQIESKDVGTTCFRQFDTLIGFHYYHKPRQVPLSKSLHQKRHTYPIPNEIHHLIIGLMTKSNCSVAPQQGLSENSGCTLQTLGPKNIDCSKSLPYIQTLKVYYFRIKH
jgi:hypothetical protein